MPSEKTPESAFEKTYRETYHFTRKFRGAADTFARPGQLVLRDKWQGLKNGIKQRLGLSDRSDNDGPKTQP